jgi:hypothetical protein
MSDVENESGNIVDAIQRENSISIRKIRSLFVDPGFPTTQPDHAETAVPMEQFPESKSGGPSLKLPPTVTSVSEKHENLSRTEESGLRRAAVEAGK